MKAPRHIVWSKDELDLSDPFQKRWYLKQVLLHGRSEDVRTLNLADIAAVVDELPAPLRKLWQDVLTQRQIIPACRTRDGDAAP